MIPKTSDECYTAFELLQMDKVMRQEHSTSAAQLCNGSCQHNSKASSTLHSYYKCCVNVNVAHLLDHWLDGGDSTSSVLLSPPPSPPLQELKASEDFTLVDILKQQKGCEPNEIAKNVSQIKQLDQNSSITGKHLIREVEHLLEAERYEDATDATRLILPHIEDPELTSSLLGSSVTHGDKTIELTRLLFNNGARAWPTVDSELDVIRRLDVELERSALTWFIRANMSRVISLENSSETLTLIAEDMSSHCQTTDLMKHRVLRTIMALGRNYHINGTLFKEIKARLQPYWRQPRPLGQLCLRQIRKSLGHRRQGAVNQLLLPNKLKRAVMLNAGVHNQK